ncbi:hypothetical protein HZS_7664 [Henneguya salminicola]|nr:hypothetical protein HZS_7664 [Henneguya salminicola]
MHPEINSLNIGTMSTIIKLNPFTQFDNEILIHNFETELDILKLNENQSHHSLNDVYHSFSIQPTIMHGHNNEQTSLPKQNNETSILEEFDSHIKSPYDLIELKALDDMKVLKSVFACKSQCACEDTFLSASENFPETYDLIDDSNIETNTPNIKNTFMMDFPSVEQNYGSLLCTMGFHPDLVEYVMNLNIEDKNKIIDKLVVLQDIMNEGISADSIDYFVKELGDDENNILCWAKNLAKLKELGYQETKAREALVNAHGKFDIVLDILQK